MKILGVVFVPVPVERDNWGRACPRLIVVCLCGSLGHCRLLVKC